MKAWFETSYNFYKEDSHILFGVAYFKHGWVSKWKGFTITFIFLSRTLIFTAVNNYKEYRKIVKS